MIEFLSHINSYANLITALATAVLAVLTGILWHENRSLRKAGSSPEIVAYLLPHPDGHGGVHFVLANVRRGPAFNVTFNLDYDEQDFEAHHVMLLNDSERRPISVLPQDEKIRSLLGVSFQLYGHMGQNDIGPLKPFKVRTTFFDIFGQEMSRERVLDIRQFSGLAGVLEKSNERKISQALEKIEKHMASLAKQTASLSPFVDATKMDDVRLRKTKGDPKQ